jgi:4a-hydroxytetrahydrobiopterin dehydratase
MGFGPLLTLGVAGIRLVAVKSTLMKTDLAEKECKPCNEETTPLKGPALKRLQGQLGGKWKVVNEHHLERDYSFKDFREALDFTNRVGELAEQENHHPDIYLTWGKVGLKIWTHNIDGLSENDFILAAKVDEAL